ncbi:MAG TPA: glycosyltransferase family 2 protein [Solirubrobacterales bacterium]|nr:glycosyltransferase family 2 protein [Solirubrobacterales bacterium]
MKPTIYIPNLNGAERLARTLESLATQTVAPRVVVVDNGSSDDSVAMMKQRFPDVTAIALEENIGFGGALNLAIEREPGDPIVLLNNDVVCEPSFIEALLEPAAGGAQMVAAVLLRPDGSGRIDSAGVIADTALMGFDYLNGEPAELALDAPDPLGPTGGAALIRAEPFQRVGGFDERIFLYYEDLDLALRLQAAGASCRLAPAARAVHDYSQTLGARSSAKYGRTGWSRGYMLRRYGVMRRPSLAARALLCEGAICAGQLARERTVSGLRGRIAGWHAGRGLPGREAPAAGLSELSVREALALRRRRYSS